ncbi:MAG: hypothetical protein WBV06_06250, partial [Acidimicrobiia bacterium]
YPYSGHSESIEDPPPYTALRDRVAAAAGMVPCQAVLPDSPELADMEDAIDRAQHVSDDG